MLLALDLYVDILVVIFVEGGCGARVAYPCGGWWEVRLSFLGESSCLLRACPDSPLCRP